MQEKAFKRVIIQTICWILSAIFIVYGILNPPSCTIVEARSFSPAAFNAQFTQHEGRQVGRQLEYLIDKLIANAEREVEESKEKSRNIPDYSIYLPDLVIEASQGKVGYVISDSEENYAEGINIQGFSAAKSSIEERHTYYVWTEKNPTTGIVDLVVIEYEKDSIRNKLSSGVPRKSGKEKVVDTASIYSGAIELKESTQIIDE